MSEGKHNPLEVKGGKRDVLHVATLAGPGPIAGGVWRVALTQVSALRRSGSSADLFAGWIGPRATTDSDITRFRCFRAFQFGRKSDLRALFVPTGLVATLIRSTRYQTLHIHLCRDLFTMFVALFAPPNVRIVAQAHGMLGRPNGAGARIYDMFVTRWAVRRVDLFLCLTDLEVDVLTSAFGVDARRIRKIANAVDALQPSVHDWSPISTASRVGVSRSQTVLFVARFHARKRPVLFVEAAALTTDIAGIKFVMIGPDEGELSRVVRTVASLRLEEFVEVRGARPNIEVRDAIRNCAVVVLPSQAEPYPIVILEACSVGVPVIVSPDNGLADLIVEFGAGVVSEPNAEAISRGIRTVLDPSSRALFSEASARLYRAKWDPALLVDQLLDLYQLAPRGRVT